MNVSQHRTSWTFDRCNRSLSNSSNYSVVLVEQCPRIYYYYYHLIMRGTHIYAESTRFCVTWYVARTLDIFSSNLKMHWCKHKIQTKHRTNMAIIWRVALNTNEEKLYEIYYWLRWTLEKYGIKNDIDIMKIWNSTTQFQVFNIATYVCQTCLTCPSMSSASLVKKQRCYLYRWGIPNMYQRRRCHLYYLGFWLDRGREM